VVIALLLKNMLIKIKKSLGRYLSLLIIVLVGAGFFAGLQATSPDITALADRYYKDHDLMDFKIVSTMGLTDDDVAAVQALSGVGRVIPSYSLDVLDQDRTIRVNALEESVNTVSQIDGRMPENETECIADSKNYRIGDRIMITGDGAEKLKNTQFTVVGTAESVLFLSEDYGATTIGDGKLSSFVLIDKANFILDAYTEIYVIAAGTKDTAAYSAAYDDAAGALNEELVAIKAERESARYQELYNKATNALSESVSKLNDEKAAGEKDLADAKAQLDESARKLEDAKNFLGEREFAESEKQLNAGYEKYNQHAESFNAQIASAQAKIEEAKKEIENIKKRLLS
jgi:putative ABC transport system permease protein